MENKLIVPEINAEITQIAVVEHNIGEAREYAIALKERYETLVFTPEQKREAKGERAKVNNIESSIQKYKKSIIEEYNKPIQKFIDDADDTRKILKQASKCIDEQVKKFEEKEKAEKKEKIEEYFNEHAAGLLEFIKLDAIFDKRWLNITTTMGEVTYEIDAALAKINVDIKTIEAFNSEFSVELLNTYSNTLDIGKVLEKKSQLEDKKRKLDEIAKKLEEKKEVKEELKEIAPQTAYKETDAKIQPSEAIVGSSNYAPSIESYVLKVEGTTVALSNLREYMMNNNIKFESVK